MATGLLFHGHSKSASACQFRFLCHASIRSMPTFLVMVSNEGERFGVKEEGIIYFLILSASCCISLWMVVP